MPAQFVHLHLHTQYSLLDGANQIDPLIRQVKTFDMPAVAITDHGNMFGAVEFYQKAQVGGIKPIIGCEAYLAPGSRLAREGHLAHHDYYHLILLASNRTGYQNLIKLVSKAYLEGFYYKPRMDKELLQQHHDEHFNNRFYQTFIVLSYCRMLHDLHIGFPGSKRVGAEWAKATLDQSWAGLIDRAWDGRPNPALSVQQPADSADFRSTLEFVKYAIRVSMKYAAEL